MNKYNVVNVPTGKHRLDKQLIICMFLLFACCLPATAQKAGLQSFSMKHGENIVYDLYFKWGLLMFAGDATFNYKPDRSVTGASSSLSMSFKTSKFFDTFFKMRDTLEGFYNHDNTLIYSIQRTNEGNYSAIDELTFNYGVEKTSVHSKRIRPTNRVTIDTILTTADNVTDMLGVFFYMRGVNRKILKPGDIFTLTAAFGRDLVKVQFIYQNQAIVERGNVKYNTHYFKIDIFDDAFESMKTAAEIWIGDDDNFLPIKLRTKLKIGYAEVYYKNSSSLAHPLSCSIVVKK